MSQALLTAFGRDSDGAQWTVTFLLEKVKSTLTLWSAEDDLAQDTLRLLCALVENRARLVFLSHLLCALVENRARLVFN